MSTITGTAGVDTLMGTEGDDLLLGLEGNDYLTAGAGHDTLIGGGGNDWFEQAYVSSPSSMTLVLDPGSGQDGTYMRKDLNVVLGWTPDQLHMEQRTSSVITTENTQLILSMGDAGTDSLSLSRSPLISSGGVALTLTFSDGTVWAADEVRQRMINAPQVGPWVVGWGGDEVLRGGISGPQKFWACSGNDTVICGTGNDLILGGAGNNTYVFNADWGTTDLNQMYSAAGGVLSSTSEGATEIRYVSGDDAYRFDTLISAPRANPDVGYDVIRFNEGTSVSDLRFRLSGQDLWITRRAGGGVIHVVSYLASDGSAAIEEIQFADGTVLTGADVQALLNDVLIGTNGGDLLSGFEGNDLLSGGDGNDTLIGSYGNDTFIGGAGDDRMVDYETWSNPKSSSRGYLASGSDTYVFASGFGHDQIDDEGGVDVVVFGEGIRPDDLVITPLQNRSDQRAFSNPNVPAVLIGSKVSTDTLIILSAGVTQSKGAMEVFQFSDGTQWSWSDLLARMGTEPTGVALVGTASDDTLTGWYGADTLDGGVGNDVVSGGQGGNDLLMGGAGDDTLLGGDQDSFDRSTLIGGAGDDELYLSSAYGANEAVFEAGFGHDVLHSLGKNSIVDLSRVLTSAATHQALVYDEGDLLISIPDSQDQLRIDNYFSASPGNPYGAVGQIRLADAVLSYGSVIAVLTQGTDANDTMTGTGLNALYGQGGDDVLQGGAVSETLDGGVGDDSLSGGAGDDSLNGGGGGDTLRGDGGADTFYFDGGQSLIYADASDTLKFGSWVKPEDLVLLADDPAQPDTLRIARRESDDVVTLMGASGLGGMSLSVGQVKTTLSQWLQQTPVIAYGVVGTHAHDSLTPMAGADAGLVLGLGGDDTLTARFNSTVHDTLRGGSGNDTYVLLNSAPTLELGWNFGQDRVISPMSSQGFVPGDYTLKFTESFYAAANANLTLINDGAFQPSRWVLSFDDGADDQIEFQGATLSSSPSLTHMDAPGQIADTTFIPARIEFGDGEVWSRADFIAHSMQAEQTGLFVSGGSGSDTLSALGAQARIYLGLSGDDSYLMADTGDLFMDQSGNDNYVFSAGWGAGLGSHIDLGSGEGTASRVSGAGAILVKDMGGNDVIRFADDTTASNLLPSINGGNLLLTRSDGRQISIVGALDDQMQWGEGLIEQIVFADGTQWAWNDLMGMIATGSVGADSLLGYDGNDTLTGLGGDDTLYGAQGADLLLGGDGNDIILGGAGMDTLDGGAGADQYTFRRGDGQDLIHSDSHDVIVLTAGIVRSDLQIGRLGATGAGQVVLSLGTSATGVDLITLDNAGSWEGLTLSFADGSIVSGADIMAVATKPPNLTLTGGAGKDRLTGGDGDDTLLGLAGSDTLSGGLGDDLLIGARGNDTYLFERGGGRDVIQDQDGTWFNSDLLKISDATSRQLWFSRSGDNLDISVIGTTDRVTIDGWYASSKNRVEKITALGDNKTLSYTKVNALVSAMSAFAPPAEGQTTLPTNVQSSLSKVLASSWA